MLRDIVRDTVANEPDLEVVDEVGRLAEPLNERVVDEADVMIVGAAEPDETVLPCRLLAASPRLRVLMLALSGERGVLYELRPHRTPLRDISPSQLLAVVRSKSDSGSL
jgi:hypothetical protein